jgi:hypothetical protein
MFKTEIGPTQLNLTYLTSLGGGGGEQIRYPKQNAREMKRRPAHHDTRALAVQIIV